MGNYTRQDINLNERRRQPHPIWRGIGCFVILIIPVISYVLGYLLVGYMLGRGMALPVELIGYPAMPDWLFKVRGLVGVLSWIESRYNLYAYIAATFMMMLVVSGTFSFLYALLYRYIGPPRYSPLDAPPTKGGVKKYRR